MFKNLRAEIAREGLSGNKIAKAIGISGKSFSNKMLGISEFNRAEMKRIKEQFFPNLTFVYLFELEDSDKKTA